MPKKKRLEGKEHYVVPVVMILEGVLNGSQGPIFYPADEIKQSMNFWNGKPVVVYHPLMYGSGIAGEPEIFNRQKVGTVFNTRYDSNRKALVAEAWLDPDRLKIVDDRVLKAVQKNEMVEVSTGLFADAEQEQGFYKNKEYEAIARNFRPDHLAILPDKVGACSIADGAGLCRNEENIHIEILDLPRVLC